MSNEILIALITAITSILTIIITHLRGAKALEEVHLLVNDRMTSALDKISNLEKQLGLPPSESDEKVIERKQRAAKNKPALDKLNRPPK